MTNATPAEKARTNNDSKKIGAINVGYISVFEEQTRKAAGIRYVFSRALPRQWRFFIPRQQCWLEVKSV
jgi:hypothetical protein